MPEPQTVATRPQRVLVTGHNGYVGSIMAPALQAAGYDVVGLDTGFFRPCTLTPNGVEVPEIPRDIRDVRRADLEGFDAVVHLAALSNDPIGNLNATWTDEINFRASVRLAQLARAAGVQRFLFSSSCIMYGMADSALVDETSPLAPQTEYARSKVKAEQAISDLADEHFAPTFLRNGTIYGLSPRMRFDTVLNNLVGAAVATGRVTIYSDGKPWRPVVHVQDVARAFLAVLAAPIDRVHGQAFNVGADSLNHQVRELAELVVSRIPGSTLEVLARPEADQRTYRTNFAKFARVFPDFRFVWSAGDGIADLAAAFGRLGVRYSTFTDRRFTRLKWLRHLLDAGRLDGALRWQTAEQEVHTTP